MQVYKKVLQLVLFLFHFRYRLLRIIACTGLQRIKLLKHLFLLRFVVINFLPFQLQLLSDFKLAAVFTRVIEESA